ncbi:hypothetical protein KOR42_53170 [Thalassoglobus neptunius]|uniref:Uncharacterized protein n=1 Tax=Thalassoglobus neptunius TaxID=1938619 RepID=A0A5C5V8V8_9PLAN|nr:hypothetical protein [Thalassoglobus neptunius]TWT35008.1 hypothetical protein KOR42_53170 [Thalassoglobus neptunius]
MKFDPTKIEFIKRKQEWLNEVAMEVFVDTVSSFPVDRLIRVVDNIVWSESIDDVDVQFEVIVHQVDDHGLPVQICADGVFKLDQEHQLISASGGYFDYLKPLEPDR